MSSRRGYITASEVNELCGTTPTDVQINEAEELIDAYVGPQSKFVEEIIEGRASSGGSNTLTLQDKHQNVYEQDYLKGCEIEIVAGTGVGGRRVITGQTKAGVCTLLSNWDTAPDATSVYRIYQLGKFPRQQDVTYFSESTPYIYGKQIPEMVKRATAAQIEFMIEMGDTFFKSSTPELQSESIGDYSYAKGSGASIEQMIAPKAKMLLSGFKNRKGQITT